MLNVTLDQEKQIAILEPKTALEKADFENAAAQIDPFIEKVGELKGLIIKVEHFSGWDSFGALSAHLKFVKNHHHEIKRIAFVTDTALGNVAEKVASHFVAAKIKHFDAQSIEEATAWILSPSKPLVY